VGVKLRCSVMGAATMAASRGKMSPPMLSGLLLSGPPFGWRRGTAARKIQGRSKLGLIDFKPCGLRISSER